MPFIFHSGFSSGVPGLPSSNDLIYPLSSSAVNFHGLVFQPLGHFSSPASVSGSAKVPHAVAVPLAFFRPLAPVTAPVH